MTTTNNRRKKEIIENQTNQELLYFHMPDVYTDRLVALQEVPHKIHQCH